MAKKLDTAVVDPDAEARLSAIAGFAQVRAFRAKADVVAVCVRPEPDAQIAEDFADGFHRPLSYNPFSKWLDFPALRLIVAATYSTASCRVRAVSRNALVLAMSPP